MSSRRPSKRAFVEFLDGNDDDADKVYKFQILLPNGTSTHLTLRNAEEEMLIDDFIEVIKTEMENISSTTLIARRKILWSGDMYLEDMCDNKIRKKIHFNRFKPNQCHILRLHDGAGDSVNTFQNMWDLTPNTDLLAELPAEYTFETALADLIDNSLQALWSNCPGERRLLSVLADEHKIVIFDTGPGMDGSEERSISKWGKMGSSDHRLSRKLAVGGNAPYLKPYFGMFGYGGPIASMHLGRRAVVSSKSKDSRKVYTLHLSRDALLNKTSPKCVWKTAGGIRDPLDAEIQISPHGSFTQVEIHDLKIKCLETYKLQCLLKDIYFPYIQCDEELTSRKTMMPIEFEVNNTNLAEIEGGEVAVTNLLSCNGPEFVLQLCFRVTSQETPKVCRKANARLKCVYFPIAGGKENIDKILENLEKIGCKIDENFENFSRVSIRRLGRLLPDARWRALPFMEPKQRKGDKAELLKRCCMRVKCFIETDAGFVPTPSKTDLAHHDPFTTALKSLGNRNFEKESEAVIEVFKNGKELTTLQLEKDYQDWVSHMHYRYDEEIDSGEDEPVLVIGQLNKKKLGISSDVVRVHRAIMRKGVLWKSGQKVKILKGAVGCTKNNLYATLEFILLEGFQGDSGGEARLICRPLGLSDDKGCSIAMNDGNANLNIHESLSFPISVIDSGKLQSIDNVTWNNQVGKQKGKAPSTIDILNREHCHELGIDEVLPLEVPVDAGYKPPNEIVAVIRPASFRPSSFCQSLDQKFVIKGDLEMAMEVKWMREGKDQQEAESIYSERSKPSSRHKLHGLYIFSLQCRQNLFCKAGVYSFTFSLIVKDSNCTREVRVTVRPASSAGKWSFVHDERGPLNSQSFLLARVGDCVPYVSVAWFDPYSNKIPFSSVPEVEIKVYTDTLVIGHVDNVKMALSHDRLFLEIKDIIIKSTVIDKIRPRYEATLSLYSLDAELSAAIPCRVMPGPLSFVKMQYSPLLEKCLTPGYVIQDLILEMMDAYGNHIEEGVEVSIKLDGLCFEDHGSSIRKVDEHGSVNLSGLLRVATSYDSQVFLYVSFGEKMIFKQMFQVDKRVLRAVSGVPTHCTAGSQLMNVVFEILGSDGLVDEEIHGRHHTLTLTSESLKMGDTIQYTFQNGRCIIPFVPVPQEPGMFCFVASHTHYPDLQTSIEIFVLQAPKLELTMVTDPDATIFQSQSSDNRMLLLPDSSQCTPSQMDLVLSIVDNTKILEAKLDKVALRIGNHERELRSLNVDREVTCHEINELQARIEPQYLNLGDTLADTRQHIVKEIERKGNTAASVLLNLAKAKPIPESQRHCLQDVIGIVALLGTVGDGKLSRILSEYLGEECMLAIVCKSYEAAFALEKYDENGKVNASYAFHGSATTLGMTINGRFPVICLDEIRPYRGKLIRNDPQRKLALPDPESSGKVPGGFLGYAVNMIHLETFHLDTRTAKDYGLRETLFYRLFGEVQVYRTRAEMKQAKAYIKHGAVSLDGGIMRDNGLIFLGYWEPAVRFPVKRVLPKQAVDILLLVEEKKALLEGIDGKIMETTEAHTKDKAKFKKKSDQMRKMLACSRPPPFS